MFNDPKCFIKQHSVSGRLRWSSSGTRKGRSIFSRRYNLLGYRMCRGQLTGCLYENFKVRPLDPEERYMTSERIRRTSTFFSKKDLRQRFLIVDASENDTRLENDTLSFRSWEDFAITLTEERWFCIEIAFSYTKNEYMTKYQDKYIVVYHRIYRWSSYYVVLKKMTRRTNYQFGVIERTSRALSRSW